MGIRVERSTTIAEYCDMRWARFWSTMASGTSPWGFPKVWTVRPTLFSYRVADGESLGTVGKANILRFIGGCPTPTERGAFFESSHASHSPPNLAKNGRSSLTNLSEHTLAKDGLHSPESTPCGLEYLTGHRCRRSEDLCSRAVFAVS